MLMTIRAVLNVDFYNVIARCVFLKDTILEMYLWTSSDNVNASSSVCTEKTSAEEKANAHLPFQKILCLCIPRFSNRYNRIVESLLEDIFHTRLLRRSYLYHHKKYLCLRAYTTISPSSENIWKTTTPTIRYINHATRRPRYFEHPPQIAVL